MLKSRKAIAMDLDWIISLGLFLIYLGVFFIVIRQLPAQQSGAGALLARVSDGVEEQAAWSVQKLPLFIFSNMSGAEPIIVRFGQDWRNFSFTDNTSFDQQDGKLILVATLKEGGNMLELVSSGENYSQPVPVFDLAAGQNSASVNSQRFVAEFAGSMLARVNHFDRERLSDFNISLAGTALKPETAAAEANVSQLSAKYKLAFSQLNHSQFVVAGYSRIISYVNAAIGEQHNMTVTMTLRNYTFFHINNAVAGTINYTGNQCQTALSRYADFYDSTSGVTLIAPEGANVSFCAANETVRFGMEFSIENETRYELIFHMGDFNGTLKQVSPYKTAFGMVENFTGISLGLYRKVNETGYATLKSKWNYPAARDFAFTLLNQSGSVVFNYQPKIPGSTNVFTRETEVFTLDKYGQKAKHKLRVRGW